MKKKIAIAAGGDSGEYEISIKSAAVVAEYMDTGLFEPYLIIFRGNEWKYTDSEGQEHHINRDDFTLVLKGEKIIFDAVLIAIHGTPGEDGKLQGYFDMLNIPYTACNQTTSALTFNKFFCNKVVSGFDVLVAASVILFKADEVSYDDILNSCGLPCFVKPNCGGSSVGMSKVSKAEELPAAVSKAFMEDDQVLVEGFIPGREISCGVITDHGTIRSLPLTEIISENDFFDYEAKYTEGLAKEITPAPVSDEIEKQCRATSEMLYKKLNCQGVVRFDYIFNDLGMYFLEVNTVPGLSSSSIVPKQSMVEGIDLKDLFTMILDQALNK